MQTNLTSEQYECLYRDYLDINQKHLLPKHLLELAGMKEGYRVLDLCAGPMARASRAAIEMGASYVASVDINPMILQIQGKTWTHAKVEPFCEDAYGYMEYAHIPKNEKFNIVICQQGINYWISPDSIGKLFGLMKREFSVFVFDTFNQEPPDKPNTKEYEIDGKKYVEMDWKIKDKIHHVQAVEDLPPHYTTMNWIDSDKLMKMCNDSHFNIKVIRCGNNDTYICTKELK